MSRKARKEREQRSRRNEEVDVYFSDGLAEGWCFGVPETFKTALDIQTTRYVDKERTRDLRTAHGGNRDRSGKLIAKYRNVETRGHPPMRSFREGDVFYEPVEIRRLPWSEALPLLRRSIQIVASLSDEDSAMSGWVDIVIHHYRDGILIKRDSQMRLSQAEFETVLRTGRIEFLRDSVECDEEMPIPLPLE